MPSKVRQLNVRIGPEWEARLSALVERMRAALSVNVSQSDVMRAGIAELEKRYPPVEAPAAPAPESKAKRKA